MKVIEQAKATRALADYAAEIDKGPIAVMNQGKPLAALIPIENADLETVALSTDRRFLKLIERSRARAREEGVVASEEMRRRFTKRRPKT